MKTREEAIKWMEEVIQDINTHWDSCSEALQKELNEQKEVLLLAIDAMLHADRKQKLEAENMELKERIIHWQKYMAPTREQVERMRGEWIEDEYSFGHCSLCGYEQEEPELITQFCPHCGAPMTDEAVQMVMERMEALHGNL